MCHPSNDQLEALQAKLQYRFMDRQILVQALIHRSYLNETGGVGLRSNERLEFLGDAILGAVVARRLYESFPDADEGWMTMARSRLVRMETLARIGRALDLGPLLLMGAGIDNDDGRSRDSVLSRAFEAVCGAVWLDGGNRAAERVILQLQAREFSMISDLGVAQDAKSRLQHVTQAQRAAKPTYEIISERGPQHEPSFRAVVRVEGRPLGEGEGPSKQAAEMDAATQALLKLQGDSA